MQGKHRLRQNGNVASVKKPSTQSFHPILPLGTIVPPANKRSSSTRPNKRSHPAGVAPGFEDATIGYPPASIVGHGLIERFCRNPTVPQPAITSTKPMVVWAHNCQNHAFFTFNVIPLLLSKPCYKEEDGKD
ncbi:hypothetical protein LXL04_011246 [Taraxacum kok-saghyz]